jgi:hypothetical protein
MADKKARGLPDSFSLSTADDLPVSVGDFLDEEDATKNEVLVRRRVPPREPDVPPASRGLTQGIDVPATTPKEAVPVVAPPPAVTETVRAVREHREIPSEPPPKRPSLHPAWKRPRRKQLNVSAEAERMLEALLRHFQQYGPQDDIKMSELFEALVIVAHGCMDRLSLAELPRRGAWGSQTEKNFPIAISEAIARAVVEEHVKWREAANG